MDKKKNAKAKRTAKRKDQSTMRKFQCGKCDRDPYVDNIVQCDKCDVWYHYSCAGVDDSIQDKNFICESCEVNVVTNKDDTQIRPRPVQVSKAHIEINDSGLDLRNIQPVISQVESTSTTSQFLNANTTVLGDILGPGVRPFKSLVTSNQFTSTYSTQTGARAKSGRLGDMFYKVSQEDLLGTLDRVRANVSVGARPFTQPPRRTLSLGQQSKKSLSNASSARRRNDLMLQRIEEERMLNERRDREYLDKKYACLEDDLSSDHGTEVDKSEITSKWVLDQQDGAIGWDPNWRPRTEAVEKFSSTTKTVTEHQPMNKYAKDFVPAIYQTTSKNSTQALTNQLSNPAQVMDKSLSNAIGPYNPTSSLAFRTAVNNDRPLQTNQQMPLGQDNSWLGAQNYYQSTKDVNIVTSTSSNWLDYQSVSNGIYSCVNTINTNPIMSTYASGVFDWKNKPVNPLIPYSSGGLGSQIEAQINNTQSYGGGVLSSTFQTPMNNTMTSVMGGGFNNKFQPQISNFVTSSASLNTTFQPQISGTSALYGGMNLNQTYQNPMNNTYASYCGVSSYSTVPVTNTYNSGGFGTVTQPQTGSATVPPISVMNTQASGSQAVVPIGNNFATPGIIDQQKIATRLVFKNKEFKFSGKPEDWPLFFEQFQETSILCGYTDRENLSRLRNCLTGDALTSVNSMLQGSMNLPVVLATLKMLYGRPEMVISALIKKARETENIRFGRLDMLIKFALTVLNLCGTMVSNNLHHHLHNPILLQELVSKLSDNLKMEWGSLKRYNPNVNLSDFGNWLFDKARDASEVVMIEHKSKSSSDKKNSSDKKDESKHKEKSDAWLNSHVETGSGNVNKNKSNNSEKKAGDKKLKTNPSSSCPICQKGQCKVVADCAKFKALSQKERWERVIQNKLCGRCFGHHHHFRCKVQKKCGMNGCERLHHILLHKDNVEEKNSIQDKKTSGEIQQSSINTHQLQGENTLLPIVPVVLNQNGISVKTFAFLDEGSTITLVEESMSQQLQLKGTQRNLCLRWTSGIVRSEKKSQVVSLNVSGIRKNHLGYKLPVVRTVESLGLPDKSLNLEKLTKKYPHLKDIPIDEFKNAKIGILIGGNYAKLTLPKDVRKGGWFEPVARNTRLGWVISGPHDGEIGQGNFVHNHVHECPCQCECDKNLDRMVTEFFSLENFGVQVSSRCIESKDEQRARHILESTTKFLGDRYETGLIWRYDKVNLPNNFDMALKRLECVEKKMAADPKLFENFNKQVAEFLVKGYARKLQKSELPLPKGKSWYLPLFPHVHPKKPEKIRPVWDAAAKYKGVSLNSSLLSGPDLYVALPDVLLRFRQKKVAVCGDIQEMYHQVRIREEDQYAQLFLWRNGDSSTPPETYVMQVMTFGSTCSPSCAQYVKNLNANRFQKKYPRAVEAIVHNHYVDDLMDSMHTNEEAIKLIRDVRFIHKRGGFKIRGFLSNSRKVLDAFGEDSKTSSKTLDIESSAVTERVLGMFWDVKTDSFTYLLKYTKIKEDVLSGKRRPTKRELLKTLMSTFDPLGLLSFYLVYLKIVMQETWINNLNWDEPLTDELYDKWKIWLKLLPQVEKVRIPRLYSPLLSPKEPEVIELHTFVDASENAYAAVSYMRIINRDEIDVALVGAKTKVAPKQKLSIPKLELLSAVLGSRLASSLVKGLSLKVDQLYFHSDSQTVLGWIKCNQRKLRQFVAFRVGEITDLTKENEWRFVPGKENVADDATKWTKEPSFDQSSRWFRGPSFLKKDESYWPNQILETEQTDEMRAEFKSHLAHISVDLPTYINPRRFSKWEKMIRVQAHAHRYVKILTCKVRRKPIPAGPFTKEELIVAENVLYRLAKVDQFALKLCMEAEFKLHLAHIPVDPPTYIDPSRFSKWERMLRAQAYAHRYGKILMCKVRKQPIPVGPLTNEELSLAENVLYRLAQFDEFAEEIAILQSDDNTLPTNIEKTSVLYKCSPYLDEFGVLRVRGRIDAAEKVAFDTKRPIILPTNHKVTRLIADGYHRRFFHCLQEAVVNELIQKFYVPGVRLVAKRVNKDCQKCKNRRVKPSPPKMAELPKARLSHLTLPFSFVGIDYFGPMYVTVRRKPEKRWGVIFTCLTIRAIHIELAETLDTASCILCIRNFMAIRGTIIEFFSDQGTNLKAADKELKEELTNVDHYSLQTKFSVHSKWNFNPPSSPHMGGSWERLIGSVKECLKQAIPERNPPYEILRNLLMEVVNIVNSRPLTFVSIESIDDEALTPNHFLVGTSSGLKPSGEYSEDDKLLGRNWRISQQRANFFWKRWVRSYLPTLTRRTKWFEKAKPIEIGDAVVIVDEKNSRNQWPKGVVIDTPKIDKNGQVRSATVKIVKAVGSPKTDKNGKTDIETVERVYVRPVAKLAILDIKGEQEEVLVKQI